MERSKSWKVLNLKFISKFLMQEVFELLDLSNYIWPIKFCNIYCFNNGLFLINWRLSRNGNDILFRINPKSGFVIWILYKSQFSSLKNVKFKTCRLDKGSQNKFRDEILILNVILSESIFITLNCFIFSRFVWHLVFSFVYLIQSDLVQSNK